MDLKEGIIREYYSKKIGVTALNNGAGATTVSAAMAYEISKVRGMTYYVGDASKEELGLSKKLEKGHVFEKIYWAREITQNFGSGYIIIDEPKEYEGLDALVVVVDPLPGTLLKSLKKYKELLELERAGKVKVYWLINKMNNGVNLKELERFLKKQFNYVQLAISLDEIYRNQYRGHPVYKNEGFTAIRQLAQDVVEVL